MPAVLAVVRAAVFASLFVVKLGQGLDIHPGDLAFLRGRWGLMARSLLCVVVLMPILALIVVLLIRPERQMAIAIAVLAASPAAPLAAGQIMRSGGAAAYGASLQLVVAVLAVVSTPLVLWLMASALGFRASVRPLSIAGQVAAAQLLPIGLGVLVAAKFGRLERLSRTLVKIAAVILLAAVALVVVKLWGEFPPTGSRSYLAILVTVLGSIALGHVMAPRDPEAKTALAVETAMRNPGLALFIASLNFPSAKPLPLLIPYLIAVAALTAVYVKWVRRTTRDGRRTG